MSLQKVKQIGRFAPRALMATAMLVLSATLAFAQTKKFTKGQAVLIKTDKWYLGQYFDHMNNLHWVTIQSSGNSNKRTGTNLDANVLTLEEGKKQNIAYTDLNASNPPAPKTDVPDPPAQLPSSNPAPVTSAPASNLKAGDLVFARKNGKWEPARIIGKGTSNGKTLFRVQWKAGGDEMIDIMENIVSAADGMKAGYFQKKYPTMQLNDADRNYATAGVACGQFCLVTYTGAFTPNAQAGTVTGKGNTVWSGTLTDAILRVTNEARQNPQALANELDNNIMKYSYDWDEVDDVLNAIAYLRLVKPVGALTNSDVMSKVNSEYIDWYVTSGASTPHKGPGNKLPQDRISPYGQFTVAFAENMGSGPADVQNMSKLSAADADIIARQVVYGLIIDAGAHNRAKRGHRVTIFNGQSIK